MERIGNVFIYPVDLPGKVKAVARPCIDGYTVYVDRNLPEDQQIKACLHELDHVRFADFEKDNVQEIESERHGKSEEAALRSLEDTSLS